VLALLFGASFLSYHPEDPSFLLESTRELGPRNWIGPVGAELAALAFGFLGVSALLAPWLLAVAAWRRLRKMTAERVVGRGLGGVLVLATLPGLLQLALGRISWRGVEIPSGGGLGTFLAGGLEGALGLAGALFVLLGAVVIGFTLLVQSTLGELLAAWRLRLQQLFERIALSWSRRRERQHKDKARRRVLTKHLERAREERETAAEPASSADPARVDLPLRVVEKPGKGSFSVRRVKGEPAAAAAPAAPPAAAKPQREMPFAEAAAQAGALPPVNLLSVEGLVSAVNENDLVRMGETIRERCAEFGVEGTVEGISPGPVITVFEFQPAPGVKVSQIVNLQDDLALALKAEAIRIDRIPGRSTLGIEVPNRDRSLIRLGNLLSRERFQRSPSVLTMALGTDIRGEPFYADLATMPHLLVAGATGAGKSVGLQSMITSLLYKARRDEVQFIFIDPKRIELGVYADIPHLKAEVVVEPRKAANALRWAVAEMERRYRLLAELHVRGIEFYNRAIADPKVRQRLALSDTETFSDEDLKPLPYYVVVIDELADLMMVASAEVESSIARLAQMARAVGIHLIVATQRPSVDILTGTIKANFPCRIAFATASRHDSRTILDQIGSEKLLGKGDMLFMPQGSSRLRRLHGAYISEQETAGLVRWLKKQGPPELDPQVLAPPVDTGRGGNGRGGDDDDELFDEAARLVVAEQQASASFLQRRLRVGFSRAGRLIDIMEREGLLGPSQGSKAREILVKPDYFEELDRSKT
jgi:DNA segregation ATPase FtsK/SpoIIIE, S-DNA-T family